MLIGFALLLVRSDYKLLFFAEAWHRYLIDETDF